MIAQIQIKTHQNLDLKIWERKKNMEIIFFSGLTQMISLIYLLRKPESNSLPLTLKSIS